jgi:outer membrane protein assembly factor BamB
MRNAKRTVGVMASCVLLLSASGVSAQDWPQWRGPNRDGKVTGFTAPQTWPKALTQKWTATVGEGDSSPVLVGDKVYVFSRQGGDEVTSCLDAASGKVLWQDKYAAVAVKGPAAGFGKVKHTGPRSTPAVAEGKICTLGVGGVVSCLDADTGKVVWRKDTKSKPEYYTSSSPLIAEGKCVVYVGALTAFDLATGAEKWKWTGGGAPYGSPVLMTADGIKQVVTPASRSNFDNSLVGVGLTDGKLLWQVKLPGRGYTINYGTPIIDGQTVIYCAPTKGGGGSTMAFKVEKKGDAFAATEVWKTNQAPFLYNTPVLKDGLLFGLSSGRKFFCEDAKTGKVLWTDTTTRGEAGGVVAAGPVILALTGDSHLVAFQPSAKGYMEVANYQVSATTGLPYPIVAGNRVFVKGPNSLTLWTIP